MIGLLGKKVGMTQIFDADGRQVAVTVLKAGPCFVSAVRTKEKDGYTAVQLAFDAIKESRMTKAKQGHLKKAACPALRFVREIRTPDLEGLKPGLRVSVDSFEAGDYIDVSGTSIGKGFQGVVKRHHFKGAQTKSHGTKMGREPGSVGASAFPSRTIKGLRMPGRMGNERVTLQNLEILKIDADNNLIMIRGAVPGVEGGYLIIKEALKRSGNRKWKVEGAEATPKSKNPEAEDKPQTSSSKKA
ncbi:MAG: 50S ribosomal protein L3 [Omnitrophica bacterium GWA2_52_8]|nr:MAG: 50S ribosomal protein L3 [Omnitrophica bacterium GWA2_52_8]